MIWNGIFWRNSGFPKQEKVLAFSRNLTEHSYQSIGISTQITYCLSQSSFFDFTWYHNEEDKYSQVYKIIINHIFPTSSI